jgi:deoxyribose-phosphate aldolase
MDSKQLARMIDHTLLKPNATGGQIDKLCAEAREHAFFSVCVNPTWVSRCAKNLDGSGVAVCTVVGFPLGATTTGAKAREAEIAVGHGAGEIDMVMNAGRFLDADYGFVERDIRGVVKAAGNAKVKVIIEVCHLDQAGIKKACGLCEAAGAAFVKTSTGFAASGATVESVRTMREGVGQRLGVKAAGGIRDFETAMKMIDAGASRIGASASVEIVRGAKG